MIKEALHYIVGLSKANVFNVDDRDYSDRQIIPLKRPMADPVQVATLTGFVDLITNHLDDFPADSVLAHVVDHVRVELVARNVNEWADRRNFIVAKAELGNGFNFGTFMTAEAFVIGLQACFVQTEDLAYLLRLASNLSAEQVTTSEDDGISQQVAVRRGVVLKSEETARRRVTLAPYRTFLEVDQPESEFVFRLRNEDDDPPSCALFEADGGRWKLTAMMNVNDWLDNKLADLKIPVIA
jgi:hypothetical protein